MDEILQIKTPRWAKLLLEPVRYKAAYGGRGSGKSHFFAELAVEQSVLDPNKSIVCIREIQKSLKFSAKRLIESKIDTLGVNHYFDIVQNEIRRVGGDGVMIFQGMQDHTAESIKSLEDFDIAWVEEAQSLSAKSLKLLRPTIRKEGSELWFSWNPDQPEDAVDAFFRDGSPDNAAIVHVNSDQNPFLPETLRKEREQDKERLDPEDFSHIWEGEYNLKSDSLIFGGRYKVQEFIPEQDPEGNPIWGGPYHGLDWGFSQDPTAAVRCWVHENKLYIEYEAGSIQLKLDKTANYVRRRIPEIEKYVIRADNARPESIEQVRRQGLPKLKAVRKWKGSVEDGIEHMKSYDEIIVHPRCKQTAKEFRLYSYKVDKNSGDILPVVVDANNHYIDSIRYAIDPMIEKKPAIKPELIHF